MSSDTSPPGQFAVELLDNTSNGGKGRRRLTKQGLDILNEAFYTQNITRPTQQQKEEILGRIKALPYCDYYSMKNLEYWFQTHRSKSRRNAPVSVVASDDLDIPSALNPEAISSLETLYRGTPNPSPEVINIWVEFIQRKFKSHPEEVHAWLDAKRRDDQGLSDESIAPVPQQPTLVSSAPAVASSAHATQPQTPAAVARPLNPTHPPISTNPYFPLLKREPTSISLLWANPDDPGPKVQKPAMPQPPRDPLRTELLIAIHEDLKSFEPPPRPNSRSSLEAGLTPYHETMQKFLEQANTGLLKKWGFQPESA